MSQPRDTNLSLTRPISVVTGSPFGRLPASLYREAGGERVPIFIFLIFVLYFGILFFTSQSVYVEVGESSTICSDSILLFRVIYRPADPLGSFYFGYLVKVY